MTFQTKRNLLRLVAPMVALVARICGKIQTIKTSTAKRVSNEDCYRRRSCWIRLEASSGMSPRSNTKCSTGQAAPAHQWTIQILPRPWDWRA